MARVEKQPYLPVPKEIRPFNVSKRTARQALRNIEQYPDANLDCEVCLIKKHNPEIYLLLGENLPVAINPYAQGIIWTHFILRQQAAANGQQIPRALTGDSLFYQIENEINPLSSENRLWQLDVLSHQEPALYSALNKLVKYQPNRVLFFQGALDVYQLLKNACQQQQAIETPYINDFSIILRRFSRIIPGF